ncbi:MAG TPA: ABC transporter permease [Thermomicrobiales bacterium]|nr:ABC transporter permease [Thermomicrobiales bacterium]
MTGPFALSLSDSYAMTARSMRGVTRQIDALVTSIMLPIFLMLLFVYVFGGAISIGVDYVQYVVPGVIVLCAGFGAASTAVAVASDMQHGVIDRFRSLPIVGSSVLIGHVAASVATNLFSTAIVIGVAYLTGFRPTAGPLEWLGAIGLLVLFILALSWVATAIGLLVKNVEAANGATFFMLFLPYLSSAFVPTDTMPDALQVVTCHQPFTPMIEALRGLLLGTPIGNNAWLAIAWFGGILVVAFLAATMLFNRAGE